MYCPNCGKELADGTLYCPFCGTAVNAPPRPRQSDSDRYNHFGSDAYAPPPQPDSDRYSAQQPQYVNGEQKNVFAKVGLILGIVGAALAWTAYFIALGVVYGASSATNTLVALAYVAVAIRWIGFAFLIAGLSLSIPGVVLAKQRGSLGMAIAGLVVSGVSLILWIFF